MAIDPATAGRFERRGVLSSATTVPSMLLRLAA
jgi:hypothetical protein